jgi:hypothetical protein
MAAIENSTPRTLPTGTTNQVAAPPAVPDAEKSNGTADTSTASKPADTAETVSDQPELPTKDTPDKMGASEYEWAMMNKWERER